MARTGAQYAPTWAFGKGNPPSRFQEDGNLSSRTRAEVPLLAPWSEMRSSTAWVRDGLVADDHRSSTFLPVNSREPLHACTILSDDGSRYQTSPKVLPLELSSVTRIPGLYHVRVVG